MNRHVTACKARSISLYRRYRKWRYARIMAHLVTADTVSTVPCDDCTRTRVLVTESVSIPEPAHRVTVLAGCSTCEASSVTVRR